jgi:outer membrane protein assembly factor BamB
MRAFLCGLLFLAGPGDSVSPQEIWPQWRGPTGDNVAPAGAAAAQWTKPENLIWKTPLPGWANSTPAIWKDAIFVTTQDEDRLLLLRIDRKSGKIEWEREVGRGTPRRNGPQGNGRYHDENNMATPSPVTDGQYVWAHFGNGDFTCYDFAGDKVWSFNFTQRYGTYSIWWGHANSPILYGDMLISLCIQDPKRGGQSYVVAHDKRTGEEKWFTKRVTGAQDEPADAYTTPLLYRHDGRVDLIVVGGQVLDAYDPSTGKQLWQCRPFSPKGNRVIPSPTLAGDMLYVLEGMTGPVLAMQPMNNGQTDGKTEQVRWIYKGKTPDTASPVVANGLVFLAPNEGLGVCLDAATGKELWRERLGEQFRATPLVVGDKICFVSKECKVTVVEATGEFKVVGQIEYNEDTVASPAVAGGDLFIRSKKHLYRISGDQSARK